MIVENAKKVPDHALLTGLACGRNTLKLATTEAELESVFRLRFEIFNKELGEGIPDNEKTGMDVDEYDRFCDHLMILDGPLVVGTYRLLHGAKRPPNGFYSETEFNLGVLKKLPVEQIAELGRGCIHPDHRKKTTLMGLFWGLYHYLGLRQARYLLGCASLPPMSHDSAEATYQALLEKKSVDFPTDVGPLEKNTFRGEALLGSVEIPPLVGLYLEFGARVLGRPAYDPIFRCHDLFMLLDTQHITQWGVDLLQRFDRRLLAGKARAD